jgi:hypothetical protein
MGHGRAESEAEHGRRRRSPAWQASTAGKRVAPGLSLTTASYDGGGENRPGTPQVARNAYPQLRPGRPIDAQFGANFACVNRWELVPIARGNPQPFCDIRRPL